MSTFRKSKLEICQVPGDQKAPKDANVEMLRCLSSILIFLHTFFGGGDGTLFISISCFCITDAELFLQLVSQFFWLCR